MIAFPLAHLSGQSGRVIELKSTDKLISNKSGDEEVRDFVGHVHFVQPSSTGGVIKLWCDRARQFMKQRRIECFGNVKIVRDSVTLYSQEGTYFDGTRKAHLKRGVRLERSGTVLTADEGDYDTDARRAHFSGNVVVVDSVSTTRSEELTYFEEDERSIAVGHVSIVSPRERLTVFGDSLVHFGKIDYTLVPKNPRLVQIDSSAPGLYDTLVVISKTMEAFRDTTQRYVARDSVMLVRNEMAAVCGQGVYRPGEGLLILTRHPVVWYGENQVSGDSVAARLENHKLRSVYVKGHAMAVSQSDSTIAGRFNQLTGRELTLYFGEHAIERIEAERQAISLYFLFDDKAPNGANRSSGDRIVVLFADGQVDHIGVAGGVEGKYVPEELMANRERSYDLDGFTWYARRPLRIQTEILREP